MKSKLIFNKEVADILIQKGHVLLNVVPNKKCEGLLVFVFPATQKLFNDLTKITQERKSV